MGPVYRFLGLTVGVIKSNQSVEEKRAAYAADITYGTNNEFGFDYLRDNLAFRPEDRVQRKLVYAIVDEVDSILIDEARTPLIISGRSEESTELYVRINQLIPQLKPHKPPPGKANDEIESSQVELFGVKGESLGKMSTGEAVARAKEKGLHVVEVDTADAPRRADRAGRLHDRREGEAGAPDRGGPREGREDLRARRHPRRRREPLRRVEHQAHAPPHGGAARARHLQARSRLHREGRRSHHRRRVHGPHDDRAALVGRPAPGRRGEGRRARQGREPDGRVDHVPELLPHVQQARRHDRHGRHGGLRVPADLRARGRRDPDAQDDDPRRRAGLRLPHGRGEVSTPSSRTSGTATRAASPCSSARRRSRRRSSCRAC